MVVLTLQPHEPEPVRWPRERVALILDGHGWASRAVVRSLGLAGWRVLAPSGSKCARSRFCSATVRLPDWGADVDGFVAATREVLRGAHVDLVVPGEDATLELVHETVGLLGETRVLGGTARARGSRSTRRGRCSVRPQPGSACRDGGRWSAYPTVSRLAARSASPA